MHCVNGFFFISKPLVGVLLFVSVVSAEVFSSTAHLQDLLSTEGEFIKVLERYHDEEEKRLFRLKEIVDEYKSFHDNAVKINKFETNPVNVYALVKHLTLGWQELHPLLSDGSGQDIVTNVTKRILSLPEESDLVGVTMALLRLQDTYKLSTSDIADGRISGLTNTVQLSAGDCYEIGRLSYLQNDFLHTSLWMKEALQRLELEEKETADKEEVLEYLAYAMYQIDGIEEALLYTEQLLKIMPDHPRGNTNKKLFADVLQDKIKNETDFTENEKPYPLNLNDLVLEYDLYEKLCRGESIKTDPKLRCRYSSGRHQFLLLAPIKEEEVSLNPRIVVYHEIVTNRDIEYIKNTTMPRLERSGVQEEEKSISAAYRISKTAWIYNDNHPIVERLLQRIHQVTGLSFASAEELQVSNYGVGGHYEPHYDASTVDDGYFPGFEGMGNRIATMLIYLTEVEAGGATVFPYAGIALQPQPGIAAFWYNLLPSGNVDSNTLHAACPVIAGSKWVANQWFHERYQEFARPCGLTLED